MFTSLAPDNIHGGELQEHKWTVKAIKWIQEWLQDLKQSTNSRWKQLLVLLSDMWAFLAAIVMRQAPPVPPKASGEQHDQLPGHEQQPACHQQPSQPGAPGMILPGFPSAPGSVLSKILAAFGTLGTAASVWELVDKINEKATDTAATVGSAVVLACGACLGGLGELFDLLGLTGVAGLCMSGHAKCKALSASKPRRKQQEAPGPGSAVAAAVATPVGGCEQQLCSSGKSHQQASAAAAPGVEVQGGESCQAEDPSQMLAAIGCVVILSIAACSAAGVWKLLSIRRGTAPPAKEICTVAVAHIQADTDGDMLGARGEGREGGLLVACMHYEGILQGVHT